MCHFVTAAMQLVRLPLQGSPRCVSPSLLSLPPSPGPSANFRISLLPKHAPLAWQRTLACSLWLYARLLRAYPVPFQQAYGERMLRVFRDSCRATLQQRGPVGLSVLWWQTGADLLLSVALERWSARKEETASMALDTHSRHFPPRLWFALGATLLAFLVTLVASLNLYLLEDASPLTNAAYGAAPLLRFSYDGVYLSALAAGIAVCAIVGYALVRRTRLATVGLALLALLVAFGGFGGLLVRHGLTFLAFCAAFALLLAISFFGGRGVATRAARHLGAQPANVLGACVGAGCLLLINVAALVIHTLILNPASHALYMQGQIAGTHLNFSLIAMVGALLTFLICALSLGGALQHS